MCSVSVRLYVSILHIFEFVCASAVYVTCERIRKNLSNTCWSRVRMRAVFIWDSFSNIFDGARRRRRRLWRRECCGVLGVYRLMMIYFFAALFLWYSPLFNSALAVHTVSICALLLSSFLRSVVSLLVGIVSFLFVAVISRSLAAAVCVCVRNGEASSRRKVLKIIIVNDAIYYYYCFSVIFFFLFLPFDRLSSHFVHISVQCTHFYSRIESIEPLLVVLYSIDAI